ncbi:hypothetical protein TOPH_04669 [Tolypocladium ophioglossoides CBS 100239]|uniref:Serine protease n=1 Tax=Tolypocladium ophioglossoides (strain CBS 100239) TaxID=1163406 RepID=A0A0L0N8V2_TOLOC|nr:hypothetical protein TOPH_04669 [Tolypocladium ophioglossoides CBS 100239]
MAATNGTSTASRAAVWRLDVPASTQPAESTIVADDGRKGQDESAFDDDERVVVDPRDLQDGGKYRSIVKIQSCFVDKSTGKSIWMMGTGWLIRPDLLVTAGHVVYDWGHHLRAATQIKCYIGYNGRASVKGPDVQPRYGKTIVTTAEWIKAVDNRPRDVAFIQVHKAFTGNLRTFDFVDTPMSDTCLLGIVGYPGDKSLDSGGRTETGAQMYEQFKKTKSRPLESGAAILRRNGAQLTAIGTHCYGGGGVDSNSGNSVGGKYGNNYGALISLFALDQSTFGTPASIKLLDAVGGSSGTGTAPAPAGEEGFMDVLKAVARVGSVALPIASGLLGPIGGLVGTAAGALLGSVAEAQAMAAEGSFEAADGAAERALLAEASLQAVLSLPDVPERQEILAKMQTNWTANAPKVDAVAAAIAPQLTECALDIALDRWGKASDPRRRPGSEEAVLEPRPLTVSGLSESAMSGPEAGFVAGLFGDTRPLAGEEGLIDWLGPVLKTALTAVKPLVSQAAKAVVTDLAPKLLAKVVGAVGGGSESSAATPDPDSKVPQVRVLLKRAVVADTALQALMSLPREKLDRLRVNAATPNGQAEGIFDFVKRVVQKIGPAVLDTAKKAIKTYAPVLLGALADKATGGAPVPSIKQRPSLLDDLLSGGAGVNGAGPAIEVSPVPPGEEASRLGGVADLAAVLRAREREWTPSHERRTSWDSNDDAMPVSDTPADF